MKRLALIALLLLGGALGAHADNDVYTNMLKQPRNDDALHADNAVCDQQFGAPQNGTPTSRTYKQCMLGRGWRFSHSLRERSKPNDMYPRSRQSGTDVQGFHRRRHHRIELLEFLSRPRRIKNARRLDWSRPPGALKRDLREALEYAEHDGSDKGERDIRGNNAHSADESHGKLSLVHVAARCNAQS